MTDYDYSGSYRWAYGLIDPTDLDTTYNIELFPRAADMPDILDWMIPGNNSELFNDVAVVQEAMDSSLGGQGGGNLVWPLQGITPLMAVWLGTNRFNSRQKSADATIMTFDATYGWVKLHCTAGWPKEITSLRRVGTIFEEFPITFTNTRTAV